MLTVAGVSRFNPFFMTDDEILLLNTGREKELVFGIDLVEKNIQRKTSLQHLLVHGPRGIGKSFFLRLLQIKLNQKNIIKMVLLPEEQMNIYQPSDLLRVIKNHLLKKDESENTGSWFEESREEWNKEAGELKEVIENAKFHLVVGIENFDLFFAKSGAFSSKENQFLLRQYLTEQTYITFIASTLYPGIDNQYEQALFHSFVKYELVPWQESQHEDYLRKRAEEEKVKVKEISIAQLKALIHFTGGLPRITAIMVDILNKEHFISTTAALAETIDNLTPFYQNLLDRIPHKSRLLFDTLIRGGEPCSQSELAHRVGTSQNVISQHFKWLQVHNYLRVEIPAGEKKRLYSVRDRLFSHYYKMRYILPEKGKSKLSITAEFLTQFYSSKELLVKADLFCSEGKTAEGKDMYEMVLEKAGIVAEQLKWKDDLAALAETAKVIAITDFTIPETYEEARDLLNHMKDIYIAKRDLPDELDWRTIEIYLLSPLYIPYYAKIMILKCIINPKLTSKETYLNLIKPLKSKPFLSIKNLFKNVNLFFDNRIILEYLDVKLLRKIKLDNTDLCVLIIVITSMIPVGKSVLYGNLSTITAQNLQKSLSILFKFIMQEKTQADQQDILSTYIIAGCSNKSEIPIKISYFSKLFDLHINELQDLKEDFIIAFIKVLGWIIIARNSIYQETIYFIQLIQKYPDILSPLLSLPSLFTKLFILNKVLENPKPYTTLKDLLEEAKKIFPRNITAHLEPIEKTILYLESGRNKTVLQKMEPEIRVAVEAILKKIM